MSLKCTGERCPIKELTEGVSVCTAHDCPHRTEPKTPTNADRIRAMSDEELCQFIISVHQGMLVKKDILNVLYWLQQPAEEDDHE